jgi:hypothetical protein
MQQVCAYIALGGGKSEQGEGDEDWEVHLVVEGG